MLKETTTFEIWETERTHRIGLSLYEVEQILHALKNDIGYRGVDGGYHNIADRLRRMQERIIVKYQN